MAFLRLCLLGSPQIERDGYQIHFDRRRVLALGIYLAVTGIAHSRDTLITLFWPEATQGEGRANLRRMLHLLGRTLGHEFVVSQDDLVCCRRDSNLWMDLEQFRRLVAACHQHGHPANEVCSDCIPLLTQAADLYRDDFLAGFSLPDSPDFDQWQFFQGEQVRSEMALVLELLAQGFMDQGHYTQAAVYAQRRLAMDPLNEQAHRQLMQLYAWTEQLAAAQRQYELCVRLLAEELGMPPGSETEELHQAILDRRLPLPARPETAKASAVPELLQDDIRVVTVVTIGLATVDDSVDLSTRGDEVQRLSQIVEATAAGYSGHVERVVGEDLLVLFGRDQVHEDDAERAVRTALILLQSTNMQKLSIRIGVATAMAYCRRWGQGDVVIMGGVVNLATRLRDRATEGQILVGRTTYRATRGLCDYTAITLTLPGFASPVAAYALVRLRPHAMKARGIEGLASELVGRDEEMAKLQAAFASAMTGKGEIVAITGAAGVGKSRLVAELKRLAHAETPTPSRPQRPTDSATRTVPILWLEGRGVEHAMGFAYGMFVDMLRGDLAGNGEDPRAGAAVTTSQRLRSILQGLEQAGHLSAGEMDEIGSLLGWLFSLRLDTEWDAKLQGMNADRLRQHAFAAVRRYLVALAKMQPVVLVFEDLHWADALSLALLASLLDALPENSLLLICLYRLEAMQAENQLAVLARQQCVERFTEISVQELSPIHSRQMLASLLAIEQLPNSTCEQILSRAQGNPLFLEEIVRTLIDAGAIYPDGDTWRARADLGVLAVPETVQSVILSRVDRLSVDSRRVLQAASVFGRLFRPRLLAAMLASLSEEIIHLDVALAHLSEQSLILAERITPEPEYSFKHVLVQEAVYQELPRSRRAEFHQHAGEALEVVHRDDLDPYVEQLAYHYEQSKVEEKAVEYLLKAGQKSQRAYLNDAALAYFRHSLARMDALPPPGAIPLWRLAALRGIGEVYAMQGNLFNAEPALRQAIALAGQLQLPVAEQLRLYFPLCHLMRWHGRFEELFHLGQAGMTLLGDDTSSAEAVMLITFLASAAYLMGRRRQYRALAEMIIDGLQSLPYSQHLLTAYNICAWWYRDTKRIDEAQSWSRGLFQQAEQNNDLWALGHLRSMPGYWLWEATGDLETLLANLQVARDIAVKIGDEVMRGYALTFLGLVQWALGNLQESEAMHQGALAIHERGQALHMRVLSRSGIGFIGLCHGDWIGATTQLEQALADADLISYRVHGVQMIRLSLAYACWMQGRRAEAAMLYRNVAREDEADSDGQSWIACALAGLERVMDDPPAFRAACRQIAAERVAAEPLPLTQWWLKPAEPDPHFVHSHSAGSCTQATLSTGWNWRDPYADCSFTVDDRGLIIRASNYFRDLWFNNVSAPCLLHPVEDEFAVETLCCQALPDRPAIGGILLWKDIYNFLRLDWGADGPEAVSLRGCIDSQDLLLGRGLLRGAGNKIYLRMERNGDRLCALCSLNGWQWFSVGAVKFPADGPLAAGLFAGGMIHRWFYPGAYPEGTAIRFKSVQLYRRRPHTSSSDTHEAYTSC
jgi:DNA-binding SARP family transcriptional activator/tetratricopeptide (TPR) repeat protein